MQPTNMLQTIEFIHKKPKGKPMKNEFRELLSQDSWNDEQVGRIWTLIQELQHTEDMSPQAFEKEWKEEIEQAAPLFREVSLARCTTTRDLEQFCKIAPFGYFEFEVPNDIHTDEWFWRLENSQVNSLSLACIGDYDTAQMFVREALFNSLITLNMTGTDLDVEGVKALAQADMLQGVKHLLLRSVGCDSGGAELLTDKPSISALETLDLRYNDISDRGAKAIANSPYLTNLKSLELDGNTISSEGYEAIANSPYLGDEVKAQFANK